MKYLITLFFFQMLVGNIYCQSDTLISDKDEIFISYIEPIASFPEGQDSLMNFVYNNLKWPDSGFCGEGIVVIRFAVGDDGTLSEFSVVKSLCKQCDEEALRVLKLIPDWIPADRNGVPQKCLINFPVRFKLE